MKRKITVFDLCHLHTVSVENWQGNLFQAKKIEEIWRKICCKRLFKNSDIQEKNHFLNKLFQISKATNQIQFNLSLMDRNSHKYPSAFFACLCSTKHVREMEREKKNLCFSSPKLLPSIGNVHTPIIKTT